VSRTLDLHEAAGVLKMHAKPGKCWVFIESDLLDWIRARYKARCQSTEGAAIGGSGYGSAAEKCAEVLGLQAKRPRSSTNRS